MTEDLEFSVPTLNETEQELLTLIDQRIRHCEELKRFMLAVRGTPVTKQRIRDWRRLVKTDDMVESCMRACRRLYDRLLEGTM
jgi:hypothetical protein